MSVYDDFKFGSRKRKSSVGELDTSSAEYLSWRRLHLSKSKLSGVAEMASFLAGFAIVATVELQINDDGTSSPILLTAFVVVTSILVATSMMVVMISTCILPQLEAVTKMSEYPSEEVKRSPHDALIRFIDLSWIMSNTVCIFLFTLDVILVCWIKYTSFSWAASIAATAIMVPVLILIVIFAIIFYRKIIKQQYDIYSKKFIELEEMQRTLQLELNNLSVISDPTTLATLNQFESSSAFHYDSYDSQLDDNDCPQFSRTECVSGHSRPNSTNSSRRSYHSYGPTIYHV